MRLAMNNSGTVTTYNSTWLHRLLEQFEWIGGSSVQSSFSSFLSGCSSLQSIPLFNTAAGTSFTNFLLNCSSLKSVPLFNTAAGTNFSSFLIGCFNLQSIPLLNTAAGTNFSSFLSVCSSLQSIPLFNTAAGINFSSFILNCASVSRIQATFPASQNISFANLSLGPTALNEIYTNLPTASGSPRTITVTGNWGTTSHNPSIATAKGWTVTA
jgi:hypothetical protein